MPVTARFTLARSLALIATLLLAPHATAQPADSPAPAVDLPGLTLNRDDRSVALTARVVGQDADWLELVACSPNSREHEALLVVDAKPAHLHLALTLLGLQPGQPRTATQVGPGQWQTHPAQGPAINITVQYDGPAGPVAAPIQAWYAIRPANPDTPPDNTSRDAFLFTGSQSRTHQGQTHYLADLSGTVISLVHFGDDTLARQTPLTQNTDGQALVPTDAVPPNDTPVTLILRPANPPDPQPASDAPQPPSAARPG